MILQYKQKTKNQWKCQQNSSPLNRIDDHLRQKLHLNKSRHLIDTEKAL
jgi:hypothetical protein